MGRQFAQPKTFLILLAGVYLVQLALAATGQTVEKIHVAPKGLQDIVKLINEADIDVKNREADLKLLSSSPPEGAPKETLYTFYYQQSQAADRLGKTDARLGALRNALGNAKERDVQEFAVAEELAILESQAGNVKSAIERLLGVVLRVPSNRPGNFLRFNSSLSALYASAGDFDNAEKHLRESASIMVVLRRLRDFADTGFNWTAYYHQTLGKVAYQQGKFDQADIAFRKAIDSLESGIESYEKRYASAGGPVPGGVSHPSSIKANLESLYGIESDTLLKLRKINEAEYFAREALKRSLQRTGKASIATSAAMRQLAIVLLAHERNKDAIYLLTQSVTGLREAGVSDESTDLARTEKTLASALIADERHAEALKLYTGLEQKIQKYPDMGRFIDANSPDRVLALMRHGALEEAQARARQILAQAETRMGRKSREATQARLMFAMVLAEQKRDEEAKALYAEGMTELIEQEREMAMDSEGLSSKEKKHLAAIVESYLALLSRQYEKNPTPALAAEAFALGDLARSSGVQKALNASTARANITDRRLAELVRKEQDLNQQIAFLSRFAKELSMRPADQQLLQAQTKMKADIEALRTDAKKTLHLIELDFPDYAALISPKPVALDRLAKLLKPHEVLVTWFIGQHKSYVWAVTSTGTPQFKTLAITQGELRKSVAQLRKALDPQVLTVEEIPPFDFASSHRLYEGLLRPVHSALEGKSTLVVVPHDEISQLPLGVLTTAAYTPGEKAALLFADYRAAPWLIRQQAIVSAPSATALNSLRNLPAPKEGRRDFIGFGDPLFSPVQAQAVEKTPASTGTPLASRGVPLKLRNTPNTSQVSSAEVSILPRLPDTYEEILDIAKVFAVDPQKDIYLQERASLEEVLKADLHNRRVVMFSTHGLVPGELDGLTQPALALTNPMVLNKSGDGLLKVDQILMLKLNADWVVLSACNTAAGEGEGAEALSGLGRAFFYAGARSLLVSSWPVDSQASRKLMTDLFKRQNEDKALSKPQALRQASLALLEQGMPDGIDPRYSYAHPLFWAPFSVVGD